MSRYIILHFSNFEMSVSANISVRGYFSHYETGRDVLRETVRKIEELGNIVEKADWNEYTIVSKKKRKHLLRLLRLECPPEFLSSSESEYTHRKFADLDWMRTL